MQLLIPWSQRSGPLKQRFLERITDPEIINKIAKALSGLYIDPTPVVQLSLPDRGIYVSKTGSSGVYLNYGVYLNLYQLSYRSEDNLKN